MSFKDQVEAGQNFWLCENRDPNGNKTSLVFNIKAVDEMTHAAGYYLMLEDWAWTDVHIDVPIGGFNVCEISYEFGSKLQACTQAEYDAVISQVMTATMIDCLKNKSGCFKLTIRNTKVRSDWWRQEAAFWEDRASRTGMADGYTAYMANRQANSLAKITSVVMPGIPIVANPNMPPGQITIQGSYGSVTIKNLDDCNHIWKDYIGLNKRETYCDKCGKIK